MRMAISLTITLTTTTTTTTTNTTTTLANDACDRTALLMGIDNENLEMVELLLENKVSNTILQCFANMQIYNIALLCKYANMQIC